MRSPPCLYVTDRKWLTEKLPQNPLGNVRRTVSIGQSPSSEASSFTGGQKIVTLL